MHPTKTKHQKTQTQMNRTKQTEIINQHRAKGWTIVTSKKAAVTFALAPGRENSTRVWVKAWKGNATLPCWNYTFRDAARAEAAAEQLVQDTAKSEAFRNAAAAERKAKRDALKAADHWTVGDVVYTSWGYDQTNVEFYQITALKQKSVIVRQISMNSSDHGQPGGGKTAPCRYEFIGPEIFCPLSETGRFSAGPCWTYDKPPFRHNCYKWEGRAVYTSSDR